MRTGLWIDADIPSARRRFRRAAALLSAAVALGAALLGAGGAPLAAAVPGDHAGEVMAPPRIVSPPVVGPSLSRPKPAEPAPGTIALRRGPEGPELVIALARPAPAAAFRYGGHVWIVVATDETLTRTRPAAAAARHFADMEVTRLDGAVALRLPRQPGRRLAAARTGATWRFSYVRPDRASPDRLPLAPVLLRATLMETVVSVADRRLATVHRLVDPVVGAVLIVVTTADPSVAVRRPYRATPFRLLPTRLGVAVEIRADGVRVDRDPAGIRIRYRRPGGAPPRR